MGNSKVTDTNAGDIENSLEEDIKIVNNFIIYFNKNIQDGNKADLTVLGEEIEALEHILSAYKRVLKENEELTISNKEIDKECSRLEEKEVKLIKENEHYKDLIYALETYYDITEEDLEECMKNDR